MDILNFYKTDYKVTFVRFLRQHWKEVKRWSCIGAPKADSMFLFLDGCSVTYKTRDSKVIIGHSGDLIYVPKGSEYTAEFCDFDGEKSSAININFLLYSDDGKELEDANEIECFSMPSIRQLVDELEQISLSRQDAINKYNIQIYKIFNLIGDEAQKGTFCFNNFNIIHKGVEYLQLHYNENISVEALANLCNISEVYFRRLFKRHFGMSPSQYKQMLRIEHAQNYLKHSDSSIEEIAETLGYTDASYFIKCFKEHLSITPLNYRAKK